MILWINGAFGVGKTEAAKKLHSKLKDSYIYDPENMGTFITRNMPNSLKTENNFQDYVPWRDLNYRFIKYIRESYTGILIIPMTIVDPTYFNEVIGKLRSLGVQLKHFTLLASKEVILDRLRKRGDSSSSWPAQQIDICVNSLSRSMFETHIQTDNLSIEQVVDTIINLSGLNIK